MQARWRHVAREAMQLAKETALEARAVAQMQASLSQRGAMLVYAAEYSNVKVLRLMRRVVFKCWRAFVKYGGSASCVAFGFQCALASASTGTMWTTAFLTGRSQTNGAVAHGWWHLSLASSPLHACAAWLSSYMFTCYVRRAEESKRVMMARRLLSQSVLGGVFGRWIAFTEQCYVRPIAAA